MVAADDLLQDHGHLLFLGAIAGGLDIVARVVEEHRRVNQLDRGQQAVHAALQGRGVVGQEMGVEDAGERLVVRILEQRRRAYGQRVVGVCQERHQVLLDFRRHDGLAENLCNLLVAVLAEREAGVCRHGDRQCAVVAGPYVQDVQGAVQLVDDTMRAVIACPAHVAAFVARQLARLSAGIVEGVNVQVVVAVRDEEDAFLHPHRVAIGAYVSRYVPGTAAVQVEHEQVLGPAALVTLPGPEVAHQGRIDHLGLVGREISRSGDRHGQRLGQAAPRRDSEQLGVGQAVAVAHGAEEHPLDEASLLEMRAREPLARELREARRAAFGLGDDVEAAAEALAEAVLEAEQTIEEVEAKRKGKRNDPEVLMVAPWPGITPHSCVLP